VVCRQRTTSNAFLEFATEEEQKKALEQVKKVDERGKPFPYEREKFEKMLTMLNPSLPIDDAIIIKMVRLPQSVTEDDIRAFFNGITLTGIFLTKNYSDKCTGTGFVSVEDYEDAFKALGKTGGSIGVGVSDGKVIKTTQTIVLFPSSKGEVLATLPSKFLGFRRSTQSSGGYRGYRGRGGYQYRGYKRGRGGYRGGRRNNKRQTVSKEVLDAEMDSYRGDGQPVTTPGEDMVTEE